MEKDTMWERGNLGEWLLIDPVAGPIGQEYLPVRHGEVRYRVTLKKTAEFFKVHCDSKFAGESAATALAGVLHAAESHAIAEITPVIWTVLQGNRVLDLNIAQEVLKLAGVSSTEIDAINKLDGLERAQGFHRKLEQFASTTGASQEKQHWGPLGIGLQVGATVALTLTTLRGIRLQPGIIDSLAGKIRVAKDRSYEVARQSPGPEFLPKAMKNGFPDIKGSVQMEFTSWQEKLWKALQDGRGLVIGQFICNSDGINQAVEHWPGWALQSPASLDWCDVQRTCKLANELRKLSDDCFSPEFKTVPVFKTTRFDFETWADEAFGSLNSTTQGHPFRLHFPGLTLCALASQLGEKHEKARSALLELASQVAERKPEHEQEEAIALLTAAGLNLSTIRVVAERIFRCDTSNSKCALCRKKWRGLLAGHLCDRSVEQFLQFARNHGIDLTRDEISEACGGIPTAEAIARAFHGGAVRISAGGRFGDNVRLLRRLWIEKHDPKKRASVKVMSAQLDGEGVHYYRAMTNETVRLPSGLIKSGLLWIAARWSEVFDSSAEIMKAVIFHLTARGVKVLGWDRESIWIADSDRAGENGRRESESILQRILGHEQVCCIVHHLATD